MSRLESKGEEKVSSNQPSSQPNANALFQVPRLEKMILSTLDMETLNKLIACNNTSPLWAQYKLTSDLQGKLWKTYVTRIVQYVGELVVKEPTNYNIGKLKAMITVNPALLLEKCQVQTHAKDLAGNAVVVEGTLFELADRADDEGMLSMIQPYMQAHYPEELQACKEKLLAEEKDEATRQEKDLQALQTIISAISKASNRTCELMLNHETEITADDKEAQKLLTALNAFRDYLAPKKDPQTNEIIPIKTGKHFNMQVLIEAFRLYDENYDAFGGWDSHKNNLCWRKLIGYMQRFLPACYAQAFAQGIYYIVEDGEKLRRTFDFRLGGGSYFPLDGDPSFRLGYNYAAGWAAPRRVARLGRREAVDLTILCQAKTAGLQRLMQQPCSRSISEGGVM
jgi:hypothetical protein